jgi:CubicO group peptidase (beta-lactamase class C family)
MSNTRWEHQPARGVAAAETLNPLLQGGLVTTANDYMKFLTMLVQHGEFGGRRILSSQRVDEMETVQTLGKPMAYVPPGVTGDLQYALGSWCGKWSDDAQCIVGMSPGAFGTFPWIDRRSGVYGIFFMRGRLPQASGHLKKALQATIAAESPRG